MIQIPYLIPTKHEFYLLLQKLKASSIAIKSIDLLKNEICIRVSSLEHCEHVPDYSSNEEFNLFVSNVLGFDANDFLYMTIVKMEMDNSKHTHAICLTLVRTFESTFPSV